MNTKISEEHNYYRPVHMGIMADKTAKGKFFFWKLFRLILSVFFHQCSILSFASLTDALDS